MYNTDRHPNCDVVMKVSMRKIRYERMRDHLDRQFILNGCRCSLYEEFLYQKCENEIARCDAYIESSGNCVMNN